MAKLMKNTTPFLVGIVGGASAGKSTVCTSLMQRLVKSNKKVVVLAQSSFVKPNVPEVDLDDHPDTFASDKMISELQRLRSEDERGGKADVILVNGSLLYHQRDLRDLFNLKLFVDIDSDVRLARIVQHEISQSGLPADKAIGHYLEHSKPLFAKFCLPTKKFADFVITKNAVKDDSISCIAQIIEERMRGENDDEKTNASIESDELGLIGQTYSGSAL